MLEAFQGWGAFFYPKDYIKNLVKFSKKNNILIAIDEMQSGFGRTGKKFHLNTILLFQTLFVVVKEWGQECLYLV